MNSNLKKTLTEIPGTNQTMGQLIQLLELPDNQFNAVYPKMKKELERAFGSNAVRKEILAQLTLSPIEDLQGELTGIEKMIAEINKDDSLSANKKDILTGILSQSASLISSVVKIPRELIDVKVQKIHEDAVIPEYAHVTDAGADIYAIEDMAVKPHTTVLVRTGLKVAIPTGYEIQIRPRSGMSLKTTMRIANTPGTIDAGYRGEVCVIMENTGNLTYNISKGDKVAQMVIAPVPMINWIETNELDNTDRGEGGFGSTDQE